MPFGTSPLFNYIQLYRNNNWGRIGWVKQKSSDGFANQIEDHVKFRPGMTSVLAPDGKRLRVIGEYYDQYESVSEQGGGYTVKNRLFRFKYAFHGLTFYIDPDQVRVRDDIIV